MYCVCVCVEKKNCEIIDSPFMHLCFNVKQTTCKSNNLYAKSYNRQANNVTIILIGVLHCFFLSINIRLQYVTHFLWQVSKTFCNPFKCPWFIWRNIMQHVVCAIEFLTVTGNTTVRFFLIHAVFEIMWAAYSSHIRYQK